MEKVVGESGKLAKEEGLYNLLVIRGRNCWRAVPFLFALKSKNNLLHKEISSSINPHLFMLIYPQI